MKETMKKVYAGALGTAIAITPLSASAAGEDPIGLVQNIANGVGNFFLISAPSVGTAVIMGLGFMNLLSNDAHKKAEYKSGIKTTFAIVALIVSAGGLMKWFTALIQ